MTITLRIGKDLENIIENESRLKGITKSELIRNCIIQYSGDATNRKSPYELGKNYFDKYGSGKSDLSKNRKKYLGDIFNVKKSIN